MRRSPSLSAACRRPTLSPNPDSSTPNHFPANWNPPSQISVVRYIDAWERPFVLCGHSSGGWTAHAVAHRLAAEGLPPDGLILLDSFWPDQILADQVLPGCSNASPIRLYPSA